MGSAQNPIYLPCPKQWLAKFYFSATDNPEQKLRWFFEKGILRSDKITVVNAKTTHSIYPPCCAWGIELEHEFEADDYKSDGLHSYISKILLKSKPVNVSEIELRSHSEKRFIARYNMNCSCHPADWLMSKTSKSIDK